MTTEQTELTTETAITIEYGATFNLGDFNNEKISIRITVKPDETLEAASARARAFVEGMHAETLAHRKRDKALQHTKSRIDDLTYWIGSYREDAEREKVVYSFDAPPPLENESDELRLLEHEVTVLQAEKDAIQSALHKHREEKREEERQRWQRERTAQQQASDDDREDDDDDPY